MSNDGQMYESIRLLCVTSSQQSTLGHKNPGKGFTTLTRPDLAQIADLVTQFHHC